MLGEGGGGGGEQGGGGELGAGGKGWEKAGVSNKGRQ